MPIAKLTLEVEIAHAHSLKDRRQVVRSIKDTLRRGFNVSVAELDESIVWNRATLGIASVSRSLTHLEKQLLQAERAARRAAVRYGGEIIDAWMELLPEDLSEQETAGLASLTQPNLTQATPTQEPGPSPISDPDSDILNASDTPYA